MRAFFPILVVGVISALGFRNDAPPSTKVDSQPIAQLEKLGVTVRINQLQVQRLGPTVHVPKNWELLVSGRDEFRRTIAISISQTGQGTTVGPTHIKLKSGQVLRPFLNGNQRFMSVVANAEIPDGFDFAEYWFPIPANTNFADVFPITVVHTSTNERQEKVEFEFVDIEP